MISSLLLNVIATGVLFLSLPLLGYVRQGFRTTCFRKIYPSSGPPSGFHVQCPCDFSQHRPTLLLGDDFPSDRCQWTIAGWNREEGAEGPVPEFLINRLVPLYGNKGNIGFFRRLFLSLAFPSYLFHVGSANSKAGL